MFELSEQSRIRAETVRKLNDKLRQTFIGGHVFITRAIAERPDNAAILKMVCEFSAFSACNDPYDEHDMGIIEVGDETIIFKIDCYGKNLFDGSPDPSDPAVTLRVLTIMHSSDY